MADYKEKLDDLHRAARRKARELDEKLDLKGIVEDTARVAGDAARRGAQTIASGAGQLRAEAERLAEEKDFRETAGRAANEAMRRAKDAGEFMRSAAGDVGQKAGEAVDEAQSYLSSASKIAGKGMRATRASAAATTGILKAKDWVKANPGKPAVVSFWLIRGG